MNAERQLYWVLGGVGAAVWLIPWLLLGRKEAWDHWSYWLISIPLMAAVAAIAGYRGKVRSWRWALTLVLAQFAAALLLGGFGNLFPLGVLVFAVFGLPMLGTAAAGAWLGRRNER